MNSHRALDLLHSAHPRNSPLSSLSTSAKGDCNYCQRMSNASSRKAVMPLTYRLAPFHRWLQPSIPAKGKVILQLHGEPNQAGRASSQALPSPPQRIWTVLSPCQSHLESCPPDTTEHHQVLLIILSPSLSDALFGDFNVYGSLFS